MNVAITHFSKQVPLQVFEKYGAQYKGQSEMVNIPQAI
jgi:hypothetical protein